MWILAAVIVFVVGTLPHAASAKSETAANEEAKPIQHQIVKIKDLIEDFDESEWTAVTESGSKFGANIGGVERAKKGRVTGYFTSGRQYVDCGAVSRNVIEVNSNSIGNESIKEIRGSYTMTLPVFKRIQLEIEYELPCEEGKSNFDDYYIELSERNKLNRDEWIASEILKKKNELKSGRLNLIDTSENKYSMHSYVANLSDWSGREIRLDLVTKMSSDSSLQKKRNGRWCTLRLIGSTFDYRFLTQKEVDLNNNTTLSNNKQNSISTKNMNSVKLQYDTSLTPYSSSMSLQGLDFYPDTGPAPVYINGRWVAYFNSGYRWSDWPKTIVEGDAQSGSMAFDLVNFPSYSLYSSSFDYYYNQCFLRDDPPEVGGSTGDEPYPVIAPYRPANPLNDLSWKYNWDNGYTGVNSAYVATDDGYTRVHAFLHVEDWFMDSSDPNFLSSPTAGINWLNSDPDQNFNYARIGYARSPHNQAYPLQFTKCANDVSTAILNNASPIIECFQKEGQMQARLSNQHGLTGTAGPAVISSNGSIYLFYTRYISNYWLYTYIPPENEGEQGTWISKGVLPSDVLTDIGGVPYTLGHSVCVARAPAYIINDESYSTACPTSPWKKYYAGQWSYADNRNAGVGGYSSPIVTDLPNPGWDNRVLSNVIYNSYLNQFMMLTWEERLHRSYLYLCQDLSNPQWGTGLCIDDLPDDEIGVRLISTAGDDKTGSNNMALSLVSQY